LSVVRNDLGTVRPYASSRSVWSQPSWQVDDVALDHLKNRAASRVAWLMVASFILCWAVTIPLMVANGGVPGQEPGFVLALGVAFTAFMVVGAVIVAHRPSNAIGWIFSAVGLLAATGILAMEYAAYAYVTRPGSLPGAALAAWYHLPWWTPTLGLILIYTPLLFPTGRLLSARWRPVAVLAAVAGAAITVLEALQPTITLQNRTHTVRNPLGVANLLGEQADVVSAVLFGLATGCGIAALVSVVLRFRRSRGVERQQLKWFTFAVVLMILAQPVTDYLFPEVGVSSVVFGLTVALVPIAAGIAILRYRLYDIDRLINRTLVYGLLTALLAGVYASVVLVLGQGFSGVGRDPPSWAVAAATLAVAAMFQPARRRIQAVVDRRFNRRKYNATRTIDAFSTRLRDQVDLDTLSAELLAVVDQTVQPTAASLWLRPSVSSSSSRDQAD
jgi:hypothetical protein